MTFQIGDTVKVLRSCRLPKVEEVLGTGKIVGIDMSTDGRHVPLYWISGFPVARTAYVLRLVEAAR